MLLIAFGTRPEYLKLKSIIQNLPKHKRHVLFFRQHASFQIDDPTLIDEELPMKNVSLEKRCHQMVIDCMDYSPPKKIDKVLVQGDTTTAFSFGLWAFYNKIPVYHLEAGLRTINKWEPYPEEINRRLLSQIATYHLCSSQNSVDNLSREGIRENVYLVGQTGLDLLSDLDITYEKRIIITMHRRENWNDMKQWFSQLEECAKNFPEYKFIFPIHWNPNIRTVANEIIKTIHIVEPMEHNQMRQELAKCSLIITDSGGLQEEGSFLQKKIIVCRKETERPEVLGYYSVLCGNPESLLKLVKQQLNEIIPNMPIYPYGNGKAYEKVIELFEK